MNKLMAHLIPGIVLIIAFSIVKANFISIETSYETWFIYFSAIFYVLCVFVPSLIYFLRTPQGIDHRE